MTTETLIDIEIDRAIARYGDMTDTHGAAALTGYAVSTLAARRSQPDRGPAPPYVRLGRCVRYRTADVVRFVYEHRVDPE